jgi:hypothetical protein
VQDNKPQLNIKLSIQVKKYGFRALLLQKKNYKISKSYIPGFSSARQQTLAQYQALNLSQRL